MAIVLSDYYGLTPDIYVGPSGDDMNNGLTPGSPKGSISGTGGAIDNTSAGDVIGMLDGDYTWTSGDFDFDADRIFVGQSFLGVTIDGSGFSATTAFEVGAADISPQIINIIISGFTAQDTASSDAFIKTITGASGLPEFIQSVIRSCAVGTSNDEIRGGLFREQGGAGGQDTKIKLTNCILYKISSARASVPSPLFGETGAGANIEINGCVFVFNESGADKLNQIFTGDAPDSGGLTLKNNIFYNTQGTLDFEYITSGYSITTDNNIYNGLSSLPTLGANDSTDDPELIDPTFTSLTDPDDIKLAFRPQAGSPAIGAGVAI